MTLFLGEGNFSFSLGCLQDIKLEKPVYCTSFELKDECIKKYEDITLCNINKLKDLGGIIVHNVDATNLQNTLFMQMNLKQSQELHKIIFNFPHVGRKAAISLNRALLKDFFISAKDFLSHKGFIEVTLSAGQGGTPVDSIQREYCNTWQIVEMATYAELILVSVEKFDDSQFSKYLCTGKRNSSSKFRLTGAMKHVFCHNYRSHSTNFKDWVYSSYPSKSSFIQKRYQVQYSSKIKWPQEVIALKIMELKSINSEIGVKTSKNIETAKSMNIEQDLIKLCHETVENDKLKWIHGIGLFRNQNINEEDVLLYSPLKYLTALALPNLTNINFLKTAVENIVLKLDQLYGSTKKVTRESLLWNTQNLGFIPFAKDLHVEMNQTKVLACTRFPKNELCILSNIEIASKPEKPMCTICIFNIDHILYVLNNGLNAQILWSLNSLCRQRVYDHLLHKDKFSPQSLFPPSYIHDFSFWMTKGFEENAMKRIIIEVSDLQAKSITLREHYTCPKTGKESLCYRVIYQSEDGVLSPKDANNIQSNVRKVLKSVLKLEIR